MKKQRYVGVMVKCKDEILLCKRNGEGSFPNMWSIPAGKIELGEKTQDAAKREFFEETAINIDDKEIKFVGIIPRYSRDGSKIKGLMYVYLLEVEKYLEPNLELAIDGDEHSDWKYVNFKNVRIEDSGKFLYKLIKIVFN